MEAISLELPEELLRISEKRARAMGIPRAEYIRRAIEKMNLEAEAVERDQRLTRASNKVRDESMRVNGDFATFERDPDA